MRSTTSGHMTWVQQEPKGEILNSGATGELGLF